MIWRRLWFLLHRSKIQRELAEEMAAHREQMGTPVDFGNSARLQEEAADVWGWRWFDELVQDSRHGLRILRRSPSFTLTAVAVLALGLGLNLALFQILNAAFLRPLQLREPETMVRLSQHSRGYSSSSVAYAVTQFIKEHNNVFSAVLTMQSVRCTWGDDATAQVESVFVSSNFFDELGAGAVVGRVFHAGEDDRPDATPAVVVSYDFWQSRLGGDPRVAGMMTRLNGIPARIVGVVTSGFYGPRGNRTPVWAPIEQMELFYPGSKLKNDWTNRHVDMYGRLKPGITEAAAADGLKAPMAELGKLYPADVGEEPRLEMASGTKNFRRDRDDREVKIIVSLVTGLCLLVLVVACANLASLMVANASARLREFQMRAALGASRSRVLRQLMTESAILVAAGVAAGWFVGYAAATWIATQTDAPFEIPLMPDWRLTLSAVALGWVALLVVGLLPNWRTISSRRLVANQQPRSILQRALVGVQVMGSCVLLLVAGMMFRKLQSVIQSNLGFEVENVAVLEVSLARYGVPAESAAAYWRALREHTASHPRIEGAALSALAPLGRTLSESDYRDAPGMKVTIMTVDPGFLPLLDIPLLAGRNFQAGDTRANAVIISRRLAERMYGSLNVVGRSFPKTGEEARATIVGVAADAKLIKITASNTAEAYWPFETNGLSSAILLARVKGGDLDALRTAASKVNPAIRPTVRWMKEDLEKKLMAPRLTSLSASAIGLLALALTSIGIFGLVAYTVSLRSKEIGLRLALGAGADNVLWLVVRGLAWPVGIGVMIGAAVVLYGLAKPLSGEPLYADPNDPIGIAIALALLTSVGLIASLGPALRALRIDPAKVLRDQ